MSRRSPVPEPFVDPLAERLVDVGRQLREARQQRGEDLYDVADYLRIKPSYLFALEEGDGTAMPGRTYAMGFLRTYADHLGFDGAAVVRGLKAAAAAEAEAQLKVREPVADRRRPSLAMVAAAGLLAVVAYGAWHVLQAEGENALARITALPGEIGHYASTFFDDAAVEVGHAETDQARPADQAAATGASAAGASAPEPVAAGRLTDTGTTLARLEATLRASGVRSSATNATDSPANGPTGAVSSPSAAPVGDAVPAAAATAPADTEPTANSGTTVNNVLAELVLDAEAERAAALQRLETERPDGGTAGELLAGLQRSSDAAGDAAAEAVEPVVSDTGRVVLLAREASWIQVQSPARDYVTSRTLEPGDRFVIPDRNDLALWTGNAGGLEIWVDGRNVGVLGQSGAVMRDISLAPEELLTMRR